MGRMVVMYAFGFVAVWVAVLSGCVAGGLVGRFRRDWDRAFVRELMGSRDTVDADCATHRETDLT